MTESNNIPALQFHQLNGLTPTLESCTMKLIEELGELLQLVGKGQGASGEKAHLKPDLEPWDTLESRMIEEAFDVAQSAVTMIFTLCEKVGYDPLFWKQIHEKKLHCKGYLVTKKDEGDKDLSDNDDFLAGIVMKFIVLKREDIKKYLNKEERKRLMLLIYGIYAGRAADDKNRYLVINVDEPYAPEVAQIMKQHGHWG